MGNMILIKDRHKQFQSLSGERAERGKYDTYKGLTHVGNANISLGDKIELAESIQSAVQDIFILNIENDNNKELYIKQINFK